MDDEDWAIRYLIVDTRNWWPGKKVLISTQWIERISWEESKVFINLTREAVKGSPEYTEEALITRDYEEELHRHYLRERYWHTAKPGRGAKRNCWASLIRFPKSLVRRFKVEQLNHRPVPHARSLSAHQKTCRPFLKERTKRRHIVTLFALSSARHCRHIVLVGRTFTAVSHKSQIARSERLLDEE